MKKKVISIILVVITACLMYSIVPEYYGARSLSLGYASTAFNYDINSIFINPAMLSYVFFPVTGYQYQYSYLDYKDFGENLNKILEYDLKSFFQSWKVYLIQRMEFMGLVLEFLDL